MASYVGVAICREELDPGSRQEREQVPLEMSGMLVQMLLTLKLTERIAPFAWQSASNHNVT